MKRLVKAILAAMIFIGTVYNNTYAQNVGVLIEEGEEGNAKQSGNKISSYVVSESFSNIIPIKQLIKDDWLQAPDKNSNTAFSQSEIGIKASWQAFSVTIAKRLDYFIFSNLDTAHAFYLERTDQPLTTKDSYLLALKLQHHQSDGVRLGYQWQFTNFTAQVDLGYWQVNTIRDSVITGELFGQDNNNITGVAELTEFYSDKNFLKHSNNDKWQIDGNGITIDLALAWQLTETLSLAIDVKDLYSAFEMEGLGFSQGKVDTDNTYINSLGGKSYLPLYRGIFGPNDFEFKLPEHVNVIAKYQADIMAIEAFNINYLARYKRQGDINFYYAGAEFLFDNSSVQLMLDLENLSPEVRYQHPWFNLVLATDALNIDDAMQFSLAMSVNYHF